MGWMSQRLQAALEGNLKEVMREDSLAVLEATRAGVKQVTEGTKKQLRNQIRRAGLGVGLTKSMRSLFFETDRSNRENPTGLVFAKGKRAKKIFSILETGGVIRPKNHKFLAIPTKYALRRRSMFSSSFKSANRRSGERFQRRYFSPRNFEGQLSFITRGGGKGVLVQRERKVRKLRGKKNKGKTRIAYKNKPLFILVKRIRIRKRLDIGYQQRLAERTLERAVAAKMAQMLGD